MQSGQAECPPRLLERAPREYLSRAISDALNDEASKTAGLQIIEGVYAILVEERPELADMLRGCVV